MSLKPCSLVFLLLTGIAGVSWGQSPTSTTLAVTPNPATLGAAVTLTANVTGSGGAGKVTFYDGVTVIATVAVAANGSAQEITSILSAGTRKLTARYDGVSGVTAPSVSPPVSEVVRPQLSGSFLPLNALSVEHTPGAVVVGDFNHDGKADLAVANQYSTTVSIFLGNGDGSFTAKPDLSSPTAVSLAVSDFNGDGNQDLAVLEQGPHDVHIFLGNGDGTFTSSNTYNTGLTPADLLAADFNGDGNVDIATSNTGDNSITVLAGNGNGTFQSGVNTAVLGLVEQIASNDFNGDGKADIAVVANDLAQVTILLGAGNGTFTTGATYSTGSNPFGIATGDLNGDGRPDLAVVAAGGGQNPSSALVLLGNGDGTFHTSTLTGFSGARAVIMTDINGDGKEDLVVANYTGNSLSILPGAGDGTFYPATLAGTGNNPSALAAADLNGDGRTDLATANSNSNNVTLLSGAGEVVTVVQGNGQSGVPATPFATPLEVNVSGFNVPVAGASVLFTAPPPAPSGSFSGSATATAITDASGNAVAPTFTAGTAIGVYQVSATSEGGTAVFSLANSNAGCVFSAAPVAVDKNGGQVPVVVNANQSGCAFIAMSTAPWITVSPYGGLGGSTITLTIAVNNGTADRGANVSIGNQTFGVVQAFTVQQFSDVPPSSYYFDAVNELKTKNITAGCGGSNYCPDLNITRSQMAIFIVRMVYGGDNFTYSPTPYFNDVPTTGFGFPWIQKMFELGITAGCGNNNYCPNDPVSRDQMAIFIIRGRYGANTVFSVPAVQYFTDVSPSYFAYIWIERMAEDSITSGCGQAVYCPTLPVSRGAMAIFVMRGGFNQLLPPTEPVIASVSPGTITQGGSATFSVVGTNTNFVQGTTTVVGTTNGLNPTSVTVIDATHLTYTLTASPTAPLQPEPVYVRTGAQEAVLPNGIVVEP